MILDGVHPETVRIIDSTLDPLKTLFLVSDQLDPDPDTLACLRHFWSGASAKIESPGNNFVSIASPGTALEQFAREQGFRKIFHTPPGLCGCHSALTLCGLLPAALIGIDICRMLDCAMQMGRACAPEIPVPDNPGLILGAILGEAALAGRDKVTITTPPALDSLSAWIAQLISETFGDDGRCIVPVTSEPSASLSTYGTDRLFIHFSLENEADADSARLAELEGARHPVVSIQLSDCSNIGSEFVRWEMAAAAASIIAVRPSSQPDAQQSGEQADVLRLTQKKSFGRKFEKFLGKARVGDFISLYAYLARTAEINLGLSRLREILRDSLL